MSHVPKRSLGGCLTCRQRKKKCDETKPVCRRCTKGDFHCLGYGQVWASASPNAGPSNDAHNPEWESPNDGGLIIMVRPERIQRRGLKKDLPAIMRDQLVPSLEHANSTQEAPQNFDGLALRKETPSFMCIPKIPRMYLDPDLIDSRVIPLILSQYTKLSRQMALGPTCIPVEDGLRWRVSYSNITRWSMYIGSMILEDISNGNSGLRYMNWITRFHQRVMETSSSELAPADLDACLSGLNDLTTWVFIVSGTSVGYSLFRSSASVFLRLSALTPELWVGDAAISISEAVRTHNYEIRKFILHDSVTAMAVGLPPLIHYDTSPSWAEENEYSYLEWVYGFPAGFVLLLAKINSWRVSRLMGQVPNCNEWHEVESRLMGWTSIVNPTDEASEGVARLAIQESWRQAILIYLYMGMCEVNSADPRVETAVRQIVRLASTIGIDSPLALHILIPCLIAGAAARQERHRAIVRSKIGIVRNGVSMILREADFVAVLDHLWHGAASEGRPTTWEDYIRSRCEVLPIAA